jgi:hypothetical protein
MAGKTEHDSVERDTIEHDTVYNIHKRILTQPMWVPTIEGFITGGWAREAHLNGTEIPTIALQYASQAINITFDKTSDKTSDIVDSVDSNLTVDNHAVDD